MAFAQLDEGWADGVRRAAEDLAAAGHTVEEAPFPYPLNAVPGLVRWFGGASFEADGLDRRAMERRTRVHARLGDVVRRFDKVKDDQKQAWISHAEPYFRRYDVLLTPTLATPPIAAEAVGQRWMDAVHVGQHALRALPGAVERRWAGRPSPCPQGSTRRRRTPIGVQLVSPPGGEVVLLGLAAQLEARRPWTRIAPGYGP